MSNEWQASMQFCSVRVAVAVPFSLYVIKKKWNSDDRQAYEKPDLLRVSQFVTNDNEIWNKTNTKNINLMNLMLITSSSVTRVFQDSTQTERKCTDSDKSCSFEKSLIDIS
jgi:hypothetical protein